MNIFLFFSALQGEVEHTGDHCNEPVAGGPPQGDGGVGRGVASRPQQSPLRGPRGRLDHV